METTLLYLVIFTIIHCVSSEEDHPDDWPAECEPDGGTGGYGHPDWWCTHPLCYKKPDESPIDIDTSDLVNGDGTCTARLDWKIDWRHDLFQIENNGHSVAITPMDFDAHDMLSPWNDRLNAIATFETENTPFTDESDHDEYCLAGFHFHWGVDGTVGSEHRIDGKAFPLEAHFVHYACEYGTAEVAKDKGLESAKDDEVVDHSLAVVSILFEESSDDNPAFDVILSDEVVEQIHEGENKVVIGNQRILKDLIPLGASKGGYFAYKGSLTTPPCTDDVNWIVLKTHGSVSTKQLDQFRKMQDEDGEEIDRNWRSTQDTFNDVWHCNADSTEKYRYRKHGRKHRYRHASYEGSFSGSYSGW
eukprot:101560_1